jgi:AraC-like DNA-binding protein
LSYNGFETLNWSSELFKFFPFFELFSFVLIFGLGPSIYLYVRSFHVNFSKEKNWPHFSLLWSMLFLRLCILTTWLFQVNGEKVFVDAGTLNYWFCVTAEPLSVVVFTTYLVFAIGKYRTLARQNTQQGNLGDEEKTVIVHWLRTLLIALSALGLIWIATISLPLLFDIGGQRYYVIEIALVIFIYWIGYAGYHRSRVIYISQQKKTKSYSHQLEADEIKQCVAALNMAMKKDKLYLDPELNVNGLAAHIGVRPKMLSAVLNQVLEKGFSEYVNSWRVEAVKQMILDPGKQHLTITGMAFDCGFNSQPTFQRAFKSITGHTPSDFMQNTIQIQN